MSALRIFAPLILVLVLGIVWLVFVAEPFSKWLADRRAAHNGAMIGRVVHSEGSVRRIHGANIDLVVNGMDLRDGDRLQTSVESKVQFTLNSKDEFEIPAGSVVQFRLWSPQDSASPVYLESTLGSLNHIKAGAPGKAYMVKDGRLYLPGQKPTNKAMALTVLKSAPLDLHLAETDVALDGEPAASDTQQPTPGTTVNGSASGPSAGAGAGAGATNPSATAGEPETLSNEYIDQTIADHQGQLQKCWLSRLKDAPNLKGQIVLQFEISGRGKVREARIADATVEDETLKKCVLSVFERISFRPFTGSAISLSFPVKFE